MAADKEQLSRDMENTRARWSEIAEPDGASIHARCCFSHLHADSVND